MPSGLVRAYARRATPNAATGLNPSLPDFARHGPGRFLLHYICRHPGSHAVVFGAVLAAVGCAVGSQYGIKNWSMRLVQRQPAMRSVVAVAFSRSSPAKSALAACRHRWQREPVAVGGDLRIDLFGTPRATAPALCRPLPRRARRAHRDGGKRGVHDREFARLTTIPPGWRWWSALDC
jgi:ATP-binding cassette subfamily B protein